MRKSHEEREIDEIVRLQAMNASMWQKQMAAGLEMDKWVRDGNFDFIQARILAPIETECFKEVKNVRLGSSAVANIAKVQGAMKVFDKIASRIENIIQIGKDAQDHLKDLENSTPLKEGE